MGDGREGGGRAGAGSARGCTGGMGACSVDGAGGDTSAGGATGSGGVGGWVRDGGSMGEGAGSDGGGRCGCGCGNSCGTGGVGSGSCCAGGDGLTGGSDGEAWRSGLGNVGPLFRPLSNNIVTGDGGGSCSGPFSRRIVTNNRTPIRIWISSEIRAASLIRHGRRRSG